MDKIENIVNRFVVDIQAAVREQALQVISSSLGGKAMALPTSGSGGKRSDAAIEAMRNKILDALKKGPPDGLRSEDLKKSLRVSADQLALPLKQLVANKQIKFEGVARGRRYWAR